VETDSSNNTAQANVTINNPPPPSSGGGGALDYLMLIALSLYALLRGPDPRRASQ
jgi:hypothetical protein